MAGVQRTGRLRLASVRLSYVGFCYYVLARVYVYMYELCQPVLTSSVALAMVYMCTLSPSLSLSLGIWYYNIIM